MFCHQGDGDQQRPKSAQLGRIAVLHSDPLGGRVLRDFRAYEAEEGWDTWLEEIGSDVFKIFSGGVVSQQLAYLDPSVLRRRFVAGPGGADDQSDTDGSHTEDLGHEGPWWSCDFTDRYTGEPCYETFSSKRSMLAHSRKTHQLTDLHSRLVVTNQYCFCHAVFASRQVACNHVKSAIPAGKGCEEGRPMRNHRFKELAWLGCPACGLESIEFAHLKNVVFLFYERRTHTNE